MKADLSGAVRLFLEERDFHTPLDGRPLRQYVIGCEKPDGNEQVISLDRKEVAEELLELLSTALKLPKVQRC